MSGPIFEGTATAEKIEELKAAITKAVADTYPGIPTVAVDTFEVAGKARALLKEWHAATDIDYEPNIDDDAARRNTSLAVQHMFALGAACTRLIAELSVAADNLNVGHESFFRLAGTAAGNSGKDGALCGFVEAMKTACEVRTAPTQAGGDA